MLPQEQIGPYQIIQRIGEGGMGAVYEGIHQAIHRRVAIKVLHPEYARDPEMAKRFINEARAVNHVDHPGVVQVSDYGQLDNGTAYIVMEYLKGDTLSSRIERFKGQLPMHFILQISWQLADALAVAHSKSIIHRDLKPGNVMLVADPYNPLGERAKLLDFGLAKSTIGSGTSMMTRSDVVMGTPLYMSPEQCEGAGRVDDRSDVYSLGVMIYEMLTGAPPFIADGPGRVISMHLFQQPEHVRKRSPQTSVAVADLVHRLLVKDREARPRMQQVAAELDALSRAYPPPPKPSGAPTIPAIIPQEPSAAPAPAGQMNMAVASTLGHVASQYKGIKSNRKLANLLLFALVPTVSLCIIFLAVKIRTNPSGGKTSTATATEVPVIKNIAKENSRIDTQPERPNVSISNNENNQTENGSNEHKKTNQPRRELTTEPNLAHATQPSSVQTTQPNRDQRAADKKTEIRSIKSKTPAKKDRLVPLPNSYFVQ